MLGLAAAIAAGSLVGDGLSPADAVRLVALGAVLLAAALMAPARSAWIALLAVAFATGGAAAAVERAEYQRATLRTWVAGSSGPLLARLQGAAHEDGRLLDGALVVTVDVDTATAAGRAQSRRGRVRLRVLGAGPFPEIAAGDRVTAWAELRLPTTYRNPGSMDVVELFRRQGVHATASCKSAKLLEVAPGTVGWAGEAVRRARRWAHAALVGALPEGPERAVVLAMTLGEQSAVDPETAETFRIAGTYHVLALSGAQVALVAAVLLFAFRGAGLGALGRAIVVTPAMIFYAALVGAGVSIVRATAMALLAVWGRAIDADVDIANVLGASAAALLLRQPSLVADAGFQLTFAATLGLLLLTPAVEAAIPRLPLGLSKLAAASLAAQVTLTPILAATFHRLSPAALLLNLLAVPLSSLVLVAGAVLIGATAVSAALAAWLSPLVWWSARLLLLSGEVVTAFPWLDLRVPAPGVAVLFFYAAGTLLLARGRFIASTVFFTIAIARLCGAAPVADGRLRVTVLDVGQGDALVVETPAGRAWVIDAGSALADFDLGERVVAPYLWSRGITRLEGIVVSHAHLDHAGGVPFLLRHFAPRELWEGPAPLHDAGYAMLDKAVQRTATIRRCVRRGVSLTVDGVRLDVLGPSPNGPPPRQTRNDDSVVLRVGWGSVSFLLTGDIESVGEEALRSGPVTMLKVPHHASRTSSSGRFLDATAPRLAVLSVGAWNHFGHPSPEVLRRFAGRGIRLYRTDRDGAVSVSTDGRRVWVETFEAPTRPGAGI
jgi:competence protein ComEC